MAAAVSLFGFFGTNSYARESVHWATQAHAQDWIDLLLFAPALALTVWGAVKNRKLGVCLQGGILMFLLYTFLIYTLAVHFNGGFLYYCAGLGFSVYAMMAWWGDWRGEVPEWFDAKRSVKFPSIFLFVGAVLFYVMWLGEDLPAIVKGYAPISLSDGNFFTNPVHVLDYSLFLPAFLIAAVQLWRRKPLGYFLSSIFLSFSVCMGLNVAFLAWYMGYQKMASPGPVPFIFVGYAAVATWALGSLLKGAKNK
jgi:hypothetical protein